MADKEETTTGRGRGRKPKAEEAAAAPEVTAEVAEQDTAEKSEPSEEKGEEETATPEVEADDSAKIISDEAIGGFDNTTDLYNAMTENLADHVAAGRVIAISAPMDVNKDASAEAEVRKELEDFLADEAVKAASVEADAASDDSDVADVEEEEDAGVITEEEQRALSNWCANNPYASEADVAEALVAIRAAS